MIYLVYGTQSDKVGEKARDLVNSLRTKKPDATYMTLDTESWNVGGAGAFEEYLGGQGLFEQKCIVYLDRLCETKEIKEIIVAELPRMKESSNIFIVREGTLDKKSLAAFEKYAEKVQEHGAAKDKDAGGAGKAKSGTFNVFSLSDAFGKRDKKTLWMLFLQAKEAGIEDEQIHGILFWQIKAMLSSLDAKDAKEAGLHPFVFSKAQASAAHFGEDELKTLSTKLMSVYHDAHRGIFDFDSALESFILSL